MASVPSIWPELLQDARTLARAQNAVRGGRARKKAVDQDGRTIRDWHHQRVLRRQRGLEWILVLRNVSRYGPRAPRARGGTRVPRAGIESSRLQQEVHPWQLAPEHTWLASSTQPPPAEMN